MRVHALTICTGGGGGLNGKQESGGELLSVQHNSERPGPRSSLTAAAGRTCIKNDFLEVVCHQGTRATFSAFISHF
jgi:hypothetical protein